MDIYVYCPECGEELNVDVDMMDIDLDWGNEFIEKIECESCLCTFEARINIDVDVSTRTKVITPANPTRKMKSELKELQILQRGLYEPIKNDTATEKQRRAWRRSMERIREIDIALDNA